MNVSQEAYLLRQRLQRKYLRKVFLKRPKLNPKQLDFIQQPRGPD